MSGRVRGVVLTMLWLLLLGAGPRGWAQTEWPGYLIVTSATDGVYGAILDRLQQCSVFAEGKRVLSLGDATFQEGAVREARAIIAIGTRASEAVYKLAPTAPVLSALITESGFDHLTSKYYGSIDGALASGVSAIYLDQPLARLYRLGKMLVPGDGQVGIVATGEAGAGPASAERVDPALEWVTLTDGTKPIQLLGPLMQRSAFVIALPGKRAITLSAAKWILEIGSSTRTPVIAYSRKYVRSGALAAVYTSPEDVANQVAQVCTKTQGLSLGGAAVYPPDHFSVEINPAVARVLRIPLREPGYYRQALMRAEVQR